MPKESNATTKPLARGMPVGRRCALALLATSLAVYGWGLLWTEQAEKPEATATVVVVHQGALDQAAPEHCREIERQIAAPANVAAVLRALEAGDRKTATPVLQQVEDLRPRLSVNVAAGSAPQDAEVAICVRDQDAQFAATLADALARRYETMVGEHARQQAEGALLSAGDRVDLARRTLDEAEVQFDAYLAAKWAEAEQRAANADPVDALPLGRQIEVLRMRRAGLITGRRAMQPHIAELDERIASLEQQLPAIGAEAWTETPPAPIEPFADTAEYAAMELAVAEAHREYDEATAEERSCRDAIAQSPPVSVGPAAIAATAVGEPALASWPLAAMALAAGALAAIIAALVSRVPPSDAPIGSAEELERLLGVPAWGVEK